MNQKVTTKKYATAASRDDNNEISKQTKQTPTNRAVDIKEANYNIVAKRFLGKF